MGERLKTIYFPGKPAKGRAKAKPWRIAVCPDIPWSYALFEVKQGIRDTDGFDVWAMVDTMVRDFNGLRLRDGQVEDLEVRMRETPPAAARAGGVER